MSVLFRTRRVIRAALHAEARDYVAASSDRDDACISAPSVRKKKHPTASHGPVVGCLEFCAIPLVRGAPVACAPSAL
jgi:hypothetical protein